MSDNLKGITLMVLAMAGLAGTDTLIKLLATVMPAPQVIAILGAGTTVTFTLAAFLRREPVFSRAFFHPAVLARGLSEGIAGISITASLALLPISTVSALMQVNPLLVTLGAALFFGETVGWRRWMAVGLGLLGMLLIIRPGFDPDAAIQALTGPHPAPPVFPGGMAGFDPALLLAVLAALALSARDLTTRAAPPALAHALGLGLLLCAARRADPACVLAGRPAAARVAAHPRPRLYRHAVHGRGLLGAHRLGAGGGIIHRRAIPLQPPAVCRHHRPHPLWRAPRPLDSDRRTAHHHRRPLCLLARKPAPTPHHLAIASQSGVHLIHL